MKKSTARILTGAGIAAAVGVAAAVSKKITHMMMEEALDREEPQIIGAAIAKKLDAYADNELYKSAVPMIQELLDAPTEPVEIEAADGVRLVGHWYPAEHPRRVLLAMHGWRSRWNKDFCTIAPFWHENGCSVLYVEQRGQGESGGDHMGFGLAERHDCLRWVEWIAAREPSLPLYLVGVSMGASSVLMASGEELPDTVRGIIADCGFTSPKAIFQQVAKTLHLSYRIRQSDIDRFCRERLQQGAGEYSTLDAMKVNTHPVLFIHGTDDSFVPVTMTYENYKACTAPKELFIVPGADHGGSYLIDKAGYEKACLQFFEKYDG